MLQKKDFIYLSIISIILIAFSIISWNYYQSTLQNVYNPDNPFTIPPGGPYDKPLNPQDLNIPPKSPSLPKNDNDCGIENCHGLDIICGSNVAKICTEIYQVGDNCRQFASCEKVDGQCTLRKDAQFEKCKSCVEKCKENHSNDTSKLFSCESECSK